MLRILLAAAVFTGTLAAVATLGPSPAKAYGDGPWCAVVNIGFHDFQEDCSYWRVEDCVPHVLAGNRGFCTPNPRFRGPIPGLDTPSHRNRHWR
jgi:hypothetical protein